MIVFFLRLWYGSNCLTMICTVIIMGARNYNGEEEEKILYSERAGVYEWAGDIQML